MDETLFVVQRPGMNNLWHAAGDWYAAFQSLALHQAKTDEKITILLADRVVFRWYKEVWEQVLGQKVVNFPDIQHEYGDKTVCYKKIIMGTHQRSAPIHYQASTNCKRFPLIMGYADYVLRKLGLAPQTHVIRQQNGVKMTLQDIEKYRPHAEIERTGDVSLIGKLSPFQQGSALMMLDDDLASKALEEMEMKARVTALQQVAYDSERIALMRNLPEEKWNETATALDKAMGQWGSMKDALAKVMKEKIQRVRFVGYSRDKRYTRSSSHY